MSCACANAIRETLYEDDTCVSYYCLQCGEVSTSYFPSREQETDSFYDAMEKLGAENDAAW